MTVLSVPGSHLFAFCCLLLGGFCLCSYCLLLCPCAHKSTRPLSLRPGAGAVCPHNIRRTPPQLRGYVGEAWFYAYGYLRCPRPLFRVLTGGEGWKTWKAIVDEGILLRGFDGLRLVRFCSRTEALEYAKRIERLRDNERRGPCE